MEKIIETTTSSFNGNLLSLEMIKNVSTTSILADPNLKVVSSTLAEVPYVKRLRIYKPERKMVYLPAEWVRVKSAVRTVILSAITANPELENLHGFISVVTAEDAHMLLREDCLVLPLYSDKILGSADELVFHPDYNLLLSWSETVDLDLSDTLNQMM